jgi:hypothetical protein
LPRDRAGMVHHVKPAVSEGDPAHDGEAIITIHVAKPTDPFVSGSAVKLDQQGVLVVTDIAEIAQAVPALLPKSPRQPMWPLDVSQVRHFENRLGADGHVVDEKLNEPPVPLTRACIHGVRQPSGCGQPTLHCGGDQPYHLTLRRACTKVEHRRFDGEPRW